jgi:hypothetical protein
MSDLKPCPFCGGGAEQKFAKNGTAWAWIECQQCGAKGPAEYFPHGGNDTGAWNKRTQTADRDRLKAANEHWHTRVTQLKTDSEALLEEHDRLRQTVIDAEKRCIELLQERDRLQGVNERDRSQVADVFNAIMEAIRRREWLRMGRGSYEYDDDRWRGEFSEAIDEVIEAAKPLQRIAGDWSDCPTDPLKIAVARAALDEARKP